MQDHDKIIGIVLLLFGIAILIGTLYFYPIGSVSAPGSGLFPFLISLLMIGLSVSLVIQSHRKYQKGGNATLNPFFPEKESFRRVLYAFILLICFRILLPIFGFAPITLLFCLCLTFYLGHYSFMTSLFFSIVTASMLYFIFQVWLMVQFPLGIFGI